MTGTAILNKPQDLYALLSLIDPENFPREKDYLRDYCWQDPYTNKWGFRPGGLDSLVKRLGGKYIARDRYSAGVVWPEQTVQIHDIDFDTVTYADQWEVIRTLQDHGAILMDQGKAMPILAQIAMITRERQANVWPGGIVLRDDNGEIMWRASERIKESLKLDKIVAMLDEITAEGNMALGDRVVVFSQFKTGLAELERRINEAGISVVRFDGDTDQTTREQIKIDFDAKLTNPRDAKWQVILCNYKTGGVGLNLTGASEMIICDEEWNPGKVDQAYGRIDRIGQSKETVVHVLRIKKTIDTWLANLIDQKKDMIDGFASTIDLQAELLRMRRDNVE
jgi:SNF2 family DNA or RNA helicase